MRETNNARGNKVSKITSPRKENGKFGHHNGSRDDVTADFVGGYVHTSSRQSCRPYGIAFAELSRDVPK